jgi:predicted nucleotidyltransferase component of viral defense system
MNSRQKPPERLEKKLARVAREQGIDQERLRHWVSFLALCGVLERACHENILGVYYLKGGVAMELRFAQRARATKDLDLGMEGTRAGRLQVLSEALRLGFDQFSFRLKAQVRDMEQADTVRVQVSIQYRTRSWQTIEVDLGPANVGHVDLIEPSVQGLVELGIPVISPVRCLGLAEQVAQKLHACTGPAAAGRARDVLDILLIDTLGKLDYPATADAARRVFEERATHAFPPEFVMPQEWRPELEALATELDFPLTAASAIEQRFLEVIEMLAQSAKADE